MSQRQQQRPHEPIKCGDVFSVEGELAEKPVAPRDAAMTQTAENALMEQIQRGVILRNFDQRAPLVQSPPSLFQQGGAGIIVGEVAESTALSCGQKPVEWSDAAAIQAAEVRATGRTTLLLVELQPRPSQQQPSMQE
ncbi:SEED MATURATION FAMILY PROTEIN [Salix koriyanagi]|uniref:SEED MATURATION FAMILY PROTEIN n=1 Tax=Salix koriyanagi TaxID=2511006 RepID=A0A9Q0P768_9ROSI|nr:SEED MATURATION FAMILY PROTEIN [Salix koriyanagi]